MGYLKLDAWQPLDGRDVAERRATAVNAQPPRYYYDHLADFQALVDRYFELNGHRPSDLADLYLWQLEQEGALDDDARAAALAGFFSYYDLEPASLLGLVAINQAHAGRAQELLDVRQVYRRQGHRPPAPTPIEAGLA